MKYLFLSLFLAFIACSETDADIEKPVSVPVYKTFADLEPLFKNSNDSTYVVNFWATTCPPCRKEMPHFEKLKKDNTEQKLRIAMISLDMEQDIPSRVIPYLVKHKLELEFGLLADQNYSQWVGQVDSTWYGALPATLIFKGKDRKFYFGAFEEYSDLQQAVSPFLATR